MTDLESCPKWGQVKEHVGYRRVGRPPILLLRRKWWLSSTIGVQHKGMLIGCWFIIRSLFHFLPTCSHMQIVWRNKNWLHAERTIKHRVAFSKSTMWNHSWELLCRINKYWAFVCFKEKAHSSEDYEGLKKHNSQLVQFGSYFYKNVIFYMDAEFPDDHDWDSQRTFAQRWIVKWKNFQFMMKAMWHLKFTQGLPNLV